MSKFSERLKKCIVDELQLNTLPESSQDYLIAGIEVHVTTVLSRTKVCQECRKEFLQKNTKQIFCSIGCGNRVRACRSRLKAKGKATQPESKVAA